MKVKLAPSIALTGLLVLVGRTSGSSQNGQHKPQTSDAIKHGTIAWYVKRAKERGKTKVSISTPDDMYAIAKGLDHALSQYTAAVVQPVEQVSSVINDSEIMTWHKLKVIEIISQPATQDCVQCPNGLIPPEEMFPLNIDEILVHTPGGSLVVEGVQLESRDKGFGEHFSKSQKYLLFLALDSSRRVGSVTLGPYGVFTQRSNRFYCSG